MWFLESQMADDFKFDSKKRPIRFPHIGRKLLQSTVWMVHNKMVECFIEQYHYLQSFQGLLLVIWIVIWKIDFKTFTVCHLIVICIDYLQQILQALTF
mmetsp:Transcript_21139/g.27826  ORF Transcript_21139/g.27826 Transcript_21139/m.27826 type:complete len:98 (+) Transcript_21139:145-438(+)